MLLDPQKRNDYNIMCAMRGPDSESMLEKVVTTAVIRWAVGLQINVDSYSKVIDGAFGRHGAYISTPAHAQLVWAQATDFDRNKIKNVYGHSKSHFRQALASLKTKLKQQRKSDATDLLERIRAYEKWCVNVGILHSCED